MMTQDDRPAMVFSALLVVSNPRIKSRIWIFLSDGYNVLCHQVVWVGAVVVTINAKLLGGNVSFFQNICLLGYCVAPMIAATALCMLVHLFLPDTTFNCGPGPHTTCYEDGRFGIVLNFSHVHVTDFSAKVYGHRK
jgi:chemotaxis receptor (MCP) glutamine deamidase CheD